MFHHFLKPISRFRKSYLPGIVTASADNDPSSVSTYSVVGATTGFSQLWLLLISTPLIIAVHAMAARIGNVTKKGLLTLIKERFGRPWAFSFMVAVVAANLLTLVADIIGLAAGFQLLTGDNYAYFIIPVVVLIWYIIVFDNYQRIAKYFFWFSGIFLAYVLAGFLARPDWTQVAVSMVKPAIQFNPAYLMGALALLGVTFSPYAFVWQTEEEIEEKHGIRQVKQSQKSVILGFIYGNLVSFFIILAAASVVSKGGIQSLSITDIAQALTPLAGKWASALFAIGLIGSGILAVPILITSSAYAVAEYFCLPEGLSRKPARAKGFYGMITLGFIISLAALLFKFDPIKAMFFSQVLVGILVPFFIYFILRIAADKKIMGQYCCHWLGRTAGWLSIAIFVLSDIFLISYFILK